MKKAQVWALGVVGMLAIVCLLLGPVEAAEQTAGSEASASASASKSPNSSSSSQTKSSTPASSSRQDNFKQYNRAMTKSVAGSLIGALGSLVPGLITNVAPLVLLFGIGALMMPALGLSAAGLLRDSRRSSNDPLVANVLPFPSGSFGQYARPLQASPQEIYLFTKRSMPSIMSNLNTDYLVAGFGDILERVGRAIDNADKRYN